MSRLNDLTNDRLVSIFDLLYKEQATFQDFLGQNSNDVKSARNDIIRQIKHGLKETNYDGSLNNTEAIFWFCRGLNNAAPKSPIKYVAADEHLFENIRKLMFKKKRASDDSSAIKEAFNTRFNRNDNINFNINNRAQDDISIKRRVSYKQYFANQTERGQELVVKRIMDKLERTPSDWQIDFDLLTDEGRQLIFPALSNFFKNVVSNLNIEEYKLQFNVGGEWHSKPLTPELWKDLVDKFELENFIFNFNGDGKPAEYFYDKGSMEFPEWSLFSSIKFCRTTSNGGYRSVIGSFFKYLVSKDVPEIIREYLKKLQIFDSLVDENGKQKPELDDCCFIYALQQTGCYDEETLNQIRLRVQNRFLSQKCINELCEEFQIHIDLVFVDEEAPSQHLKEKVCSISNKEKKRFMGVKKAAPNRTHKFNIYEKHYFIEEKTPFSTYYVKNWKTINDESKFDKEYRKDSRKQKGYYWRSDVAKMTASNLVLTLFNDNMFKKITYGEYSILNTVYYNEIDSDVSNVKLEYNDNYCTKLIAPRTYKKNIKIKMDPTYWYADFEADTSGPVHKAYMVVVQNQRGTLCEEYRGELCAQKLLEFLPDQAVVYFHNLAYDIRFLAQYGIDKSIIKGTRTMMTDIKYEGKLIHFKDSLPILSCKISDLPKMFDIKDIQKEIFPYKYYTFERLQRNYGVINEAGEEEDKKWTEEDYELFRNNIDKIQGCRIDEEHFDMWKYCSFYCRQDVNILRIGFNKFRDGFLLDFKIDPYKFISISSLANEVFNQRVYYNKDLYQVGGVVRKFCSHAVYGGRCMTAYNKKWHIKNKTLCDFDAVSLYPSAMSRIYTVKGKPKVISPNQLNIEFLSKQSAYIVEIKIKAVHKHYAFPLIVKKTKDGNLNDDYLAKGETISMIVDNITLEDLIEFQKIEYDIIRGYYWDGEKDYTIQEEIKKIFQKRVEYKKQKNPLQQLYKLIMNSCYGKTIERPIEKDYRYFREGEDLNRYWKKNYNKIVDDIKIEGKNGPIHAVRTLKPIDKHFNFSLLGIQVLSMSKRIMNEVMCLAFDMGCRIYYQDTDSFMIEKDDLNFLEKAFKEIYKRELIGSNLGQFHCDFPNIKDHDEMPWSIEAFFLMKKMYIHKITDSSGEIDYVIRGKGLTLKSIEYLAKEKFESDYMKLYEAIFNGTTQTFDLTKGQPCFQLNKNMTVSTLNEFKRRIKTTYEEGDVKLYFDYAEEKNIE